MTILNALRAAPPKIGEIQLTADRSCRRWRLRPTAGWR